MKTRALLLFLHLQARLSLSSARTVGAGLGWLAWVFPTRMKSTTLTNLRLCFPQLSSSEIRSLAKRSLRQTFMTVAETGPVWLWPVELALSKVFEVEGLEVLKQAKSEGKGVVVLVPHLGNWEILGLYLNTCGCGQTSQLYQAPDSAELDELIYKSRSRAGANMVATDNKGVGALLRALRNGEITAILPDQVPPVSGGEFAAFFGVDALTMTLASRLIQKTGARAVLGYAQRIKTAKGDGFKIIFTKASDNVYAKHMPSAIKALNQVVEDAVMVIPEQYQWEYKRFKRQSDGRKVY